MSQEIVPQTTALSLSFDNQALRALKQQSDSLVAFVNDQLKKESDYGLVPGSKKPSLFKPGAEKLAKLFSLGTRIIHRDRILNEEYAFFSYTIELFHIPTGQALSQCEGSANSDEDKYKKQIERYKKTPHEFLNTLMKMAQKRAFVGAVIQATGASDFFTQDLEDMAPLPEAQHHVSKGPDPYHGPETRKPSEKQLKRLYVIQKSNNIDQQAVKDYMLSNFGISSSKELNLAQYDQLCAAMEDGKINMKQDKAMDAAVAAVEEKFEPPFEDDVP